ncbi:MULTISPECIES: RagB/SusD family nutrient uptake outer membrane protein [Niastella]|uniref:RagB/SusD family nutrient uptake outer membrane protein n=1 Tax=Niastella soli TaxID=2821487 RepID=A0ABS3YY63_9BACT|nr:RagB/SusD family nutrient uptake outer membrane protein [Niastella soli]MBO9202862.1 RagB/SusD family nutrient uptake outer membrane protein [Niastella soli]
MKIKRIKNLLYKSLFGLTITLSVTSCKLDEYNPVTLSEQDVLSKYDGWKAYQSNCYTGLWGTTIGMPYGICSEVGTDLWTFPSNSTSYKEVIAYQDLTVSFNLVNNIFTYAWGSVKDCNKTIQLAPQLIDGKASDINTLVAEAKLLRAYYYSVLVTQFGELPLVLTDEPTKNLSPTRNSVPEIYTQIIADLRDAFNDLPVTPMDNNPQRVTKKAALGLLARVYAQGAGEGLSEGGKSYWVRAKECADSLINGMGTYGAAMYDDFSKVFAATNNRNNQEVLFTAYGLNPYSASYDVSTANAKPNLYLHFYPKFDDAFGTSDVFKRSVNSNSSNAYYGRLNQAFIAPTKYLINCFNATYDKRWENTFQTAFTNYSGVRAISSLGSGAPGPANVKYTDATVTINQAMCTKYGIDPKHIGKKIYPYIDVDARNASKNASWQYIPQVWNKGAITGTTAGNLTDVANANVHPYPLTQDENRFFAYLSKDPLTPADKAERAYVTVNIDDLFDKSDPTGSTYKANAAGNGFPTSSLATLFPAMQKFNFNFDGSWLGGDFQRKLGNIMIMRMAEVYLIAAEATMHTSGDGAAAANYLNVLRKRACRNQADYNVGTGMQLTTATMNDVFDEYARELCGEFNRWPLLKRNKAFESRLQTYNKRAAANFNASKHYLRPIPFTFLNQINNADQFGNNGY